MVDALTRGASFGALAVGFTTVATRGATMAEIQFFLNAGRLIGPLAGGKLASMDVGTLPWLLAAACSIARTGDAVPRRPSRLSG